MGFFKKPNILVYDSERMDHAKKYIQDIVVYINNLKDDANFRHGLEGRYDVCDPYEPQSVLECAGHLDELDSEQQYRPGNQKAF